MERKQVTPERLANSPRDYHGRQIRLRLPCISDEKAGFTCVTKVDEQILKVDAVVLGPKPPLVIAERLITDCKGTANLDRPACIVNAIFTLTNSLKHPLETAKGTLPITVLYAREIEMFPSER